MQKPGNTVQKKKTATEKGAALNSVWNRAYTAKSEWPQKDEFLDVIYWARQILALLLGIFWGVLPLKGIFGLLLFCAVNAAVIYFYFSTFQKVDEDEFGGTWELTKEGFVASFAVFLVTWIVTYSGLHFD